MEKEAEIKTGEYVYHKQKKGYISEFFDHLITYGGFSFGNGVMSVWGDPSLFITKNALTIYYHELKKALGQEADDIFYWLGHLYGKNSSIMLIKKFGFDRKKISDFINGATQDGFGYITVNKMKYSTNTFVAEVEGKNSNLSINYKKMFGKQKKPLDFYMAGILAGGAEPLFDMSIGIKEIKCIGKGDKKCVYSVKNIKSCEHFKFLDKLEWNSNEIIKKTKVTGEKRTISFSFLGKKDIKFGDGSFILKGYKGFNMASYEHLILDKITLSLLGNKRFKEIKEKVAQAYINDTFNSKIVSKTILMNNLKNLLEHLKIFGYGNLEIYRISGNNIIIKNENNPYAFDEKNLFGMIDNLSSDMICKLILFGIKKYFNKSAEVSVMKNSVNEAFIRINF